MQKYDFFLKTGFYFKKNAPSLFFVRQILGKVA